MSFDELIRQVAAEHQQELTDQAIAHAAEVGRLKARIPADGECLISVRQQASAWQAVCSTLDRLVPDLGLQRGSARDLAIAAIERLAANAVPDPNTSQSAHFKAWSAVVDALNEHAPSWKDQTDRKATGIQLAVHAIRKMAERIKELEGLTKSGVLCVNETDDDDGWIEWKGGEWVRQKQDR